MSAITQGTLVPLGFALAMIGGGAGWATRQEIMANDNKSRISEVEQRFNGIQKKLVEISERLGRIEGHLERGMK